MKIAKVTKNAKRKTPHLKTLENEKNDEKPTNEKI